MPYMTQDNYGFHNFDDAVRDGAVAAASAYSENFTRWVKRYAFELEELFEIGGPNHFGKAGRHVAWLAEKIFKRDTPAFDPDMSFENVIETYCQGHVFGGLRDYLCDLLTYHAEEDAPFPDPWIKAGKIDGYAIAPITTADELWDEGERMHNCVANYVSDVVSGETYFFHVSKDGERVATVQLEQTPHRYRIEEIKGICNADVPDDVLTAVRRWISRKARR